MMTIKQRKFYMAEAAKLTLQLRNGLTRKEAVKRYIECEDALWYIERDNMTIGKSTRKVRDLHEAMRKAYFQAAR